MESNDVTIQEYDKNHFKIECTENYFSTKLDHSKLNDGHYYIHMKNHNVSSMLLHKVTMRLVFAENCTPDSEIYMLPVAKCKFGKDSIIVVGVESEEQIEVFYKCKYWQLEVLDNNDLYIFTAPKKPKVVVIYF